MVHCLPLEKGLPEIHRLSVYQPTLRCANRLLPFRQRMGGGASFCMHLVFLISKSQLSVKLWLRPCRCSLLLSSTEQFQLWKEPKDRGVTFYIAVQDSQYCPRHSHHSQFWETPVQLNSVKKKIDLKICPVFFMLGSVLHLSMFCKALVFKWKVLSKKGSRTKAKSFFLRFVKRKTFLSKRRMGLPLPFLKNC